MKAYYKSKVKAAQLKISEDLVNLSSTEEDLFHEFETFPGTIFDYLKNVGGSRPYNRHMDIDIVNDIINDRFLPISGLQTTLVRKFNYLPINNHHAKRVYFDKNAFKKGYHSCEKKYHKRIDDLKKRMSREVNK